MLFYLIKEKKRGISGQCWGERGGEGPFNSPSNPHRHLILSWPPLRLCFLSPSRTSLLAPAAHPRRRLLPHRPPPRPSPPATAAPVDATPSPTGPTSAPPPHIPALADPPPLPPSLVSAPPAHARRRPSPATRSSSSPTSVSARAPFLLLRGMSDPVIPTLHPGKASPHPRPKDAPRTPQRRLT